jgi:hypothetical protein
MNGLLKERGGSLLRFEQGIFEVLCWGQRVRKATVTAHPIWKTKQELS